MTKEGPAVAKTIPAVSKVYPAVAELLPTMVKVYPTVAKLIPAGGISKGSVNAAQAHTTKRISLWKCPERGRVFRSFSCCNMSQQMRGRRCGAEDLLFDT